MKLTAGIWKSHLQNAHKSQKSPERVDRTWQLVPLISVPYLTVDIHYELAAAPRKGEPDELVELLKMKSGNERGESAVKVASLSPKRRRLLTRSDYGGGEALLEFFRKLVIHNTQKAETEFLHRSFFIKRG